MSTTRTSIGQKWSDVVDRAFGYAGLILIGAMGWTCERVGYRSASASRPPEQAMPRQVEA